MHTNLDGIPRAAGQVQADEVRLCYLDSVPFTMVIQGNAILSEGVADTSRCSEETYVLYTGSSRTFQSCVREQDTALQVPAPSGPWGRSFPLEYGVLLKLPT